MGNDLVQKVKEIAKQDGSSVVALAGKLEGEIMEIEDLEEQQSFYGRNGAGPKPDSTA